MQSCGVPFHCVHHDTGHLHNCPAGSWNMTSHIMHNVQVPVEWGRLIHALQSRLINSRSVCLFDIPDTRETGHCRSNVLNSSLGTGGPVAPAISTRVTSWNPQGAALSSGISTQTLFLALPCSTRVGAVPSSRARKPITSGTAPGPTQPPRRVQCHNRLRAFHRTSS